MRVCTFYRFYNSMVPSHFSVYSSIKFALLSHTPAQIISNLQTAVPAIIKNVKGEWGNIQSLHIKTNSSVSLPVWTCSLDESEGGRWGGLTLDDEEDEMVVDEENDVEAVVEKKAKGAREDDVAERKGKGKRVSEEEMEVNPKKKAKSKGAEEPPVEPRGPAAVPEKQSKSKKEVPIPPTTSVSTATVEALNTKPKKRKSSIPADVQLTTSLEAPDVALSKKKRRKSEGGDGANTSPAPPKAPAAGTDPPHPATAKKERKSRSEEETATTTAEREKTLFAAVAMISEKISLRPPGSEEILETKKEKKKKRKSGIADAGTSAATACAQDSAMPNTELPAEAVSETTTNSGPSKDKGGKGLSKEGLKQKRSAEGGERKKNKVVKGTIGRSAKDDIVGKKSKGTA
jgi:ribosome biogenesis protein UTP30